MSAPRKVQCFLNQYEMRFGVNTLLFGPFAAILSQLADNKFCPQVCDGGQLLH